MRTTTLTGDVMNTSIAEPPAARKPAGTSSPFSHRKMLWTKILEFNFFQNADQTYVEASLQFLATWRR